MSWTYVRFIGDNVRPDEDTTPRTGLMCPIENDSVALVVPVFRGGTHPTWNLYTMDGIAVSDDFVDIELATHITMLETEMQQGSGTAAAEEAEQYCEPLEKHFGIFEEEEEP